MWGLEPVIKINLWTQLAERVIGTIPRNQLNELVTGTNYRVYHTKVLLYKGIIVKGIIHTKVLLNKGIIRN